MSHEYLIKKWKMWFNMLDLHHHQKIAKADVYQIETTFAHLSHLDATKRRSVLSAVDKWWTEYIFRGKPGPVTEQDFVDALDNDYKANKEAFVEWIKRCVRTIYDILDINHEGSLTEEEYVNAYRSIGHDASHDRKFFNAYKPVDGKVPVNVLNDSWIQFLTCEDSSKPDVVRDVLEAGF